MTSSPEKTMVALQNFGSNIDLGAKAEKTLLGKEDMTSQRLPIHETHDQAVLHSLQELSKMGLNC